LIQINERRLRRTVLVVRPQHRRDNRPKSYVCDDAVADCGRRREGPARSLGRRGPAGVPGGKGGWRGMPAEYHHTGASEEGWSGSTAHHASL